jgi:DNA-directed RNA polymerase sigma subunit (sigma70/sigma32)
VTQVTKLDYLKIREILRKILDTACINAYNFTEHKIMEERMKKYLTTAEIGELFQVTRETIRNWRNAGMPHEKLSNRVYRYELDKILAWAKTREANFNETKN